MSYNLEVKMICIAHEVNLFTTPYAFNPDGAVRVVKAGANVIVAYCDYTMGGSIGAEFIMDLDITVETVQEIHDAATSKRSDVIVLCHGGSISSPEDAKYVLIHTKGAHGFYGVFSVKCLPVEVAVRGHIEKFKKITF